MMAAIPSQIKACEASGKKNDPNKDKKLTSIFAVELYVNPLQIEYNTDAELQSYLKSLPPDQLKIMRKRGYHLLAIAYNDIGYSNLVNLSSIAWTKGYYYRPRVNHEQLLKYKEGIIFTSCCYASEIGQAFEEGGEDAGFAMIEKYMAMFGDKFYLEFMLLDFVKQKPYDAFIMKAHEKYKLPLLLSNDVHYCNEEDSKYQRLMLMVQTQNTIQDIQRKMAEEGLQDMFELQDSNLWMKTEEEINQKWLKDYSDVIDYDLFKQAKRNTVEVCRQAKGVKLDRSIKLPQIPDADLKLKEFTMQGFKNRNLPMTRKYLDRIKEEYSLITHKEFASYFLIQKQMTDEARRICKELLGWGDGSEAVGPGRGCLSPDSPIIMADGSRKLIPEVKAGDFVITRDGSAQLVEGIAEYPCNEEMVRLHCYYGDKLGVGLTKDHKVLAEKFKNVDKWDTWAESTKSSRKSIKEPEGKLEWIPAGELRVGDWVFVPTPKNNNLDIDCNIDLSKYCNDKEMHCDDNYVYQDWFNPLTGQLRNQKSVVRKFYLDNDWFTLLGLFTGDGWLQSKAKNVVGFCFHEEDSFGIALLKHKLHQLGAEYTVRPKYKKKKVIQVMVRSRYLYELFREFFDEYKYTSETKHVPLFVMFSNEEQKRAYLKGYHMADGGTEYCNKYTTCSSVLSDQIRYLNWQLNIPASHAVYDRLDKRTNREYKEIASKTARSFGIGIDEDFKQYQFRLVEGGMLLRLRKVEKLIGVDKVYDIQVANNHNYLTTSFLVHNSAVGSLICYCLGITDVDPVRHDLLFKRFLSEARGGRTLSLRFKNVDPLPLEEYAA